MARRAIQWGLAGALLALAAAPALPQDAPTAPQEAPPRPPETPTSILPDVFGPQAPPAAEPVEPAAPILPPGMAGGGALPAAPALPGSASATPPVEENREVLAGPVRPAAAAGLLSPATVGVPAGYFALADGRFLAALLARLEGPLASRWGQIALTRALLSRTAPPPGIHPGDWVAARARALVALGAAADAHRMVSRVRLADYTPRLFAAAAEAALAAADPIGLCPIAAEGRSISNDNAAFVLADALCTAIAGDPFSANQLFEEARRSRIVDPFDIQLAERVASLAGGTRSAGNPVWAEVEGLTAWRIGLAGAVGLEVPEAMLATAPAPARLWLLRMPRVSVARRVALAPEGAAAGLLSGAEVQRLYALDLESRPVGEAGSSPGGQLRTALQAPDADQRVAAIRAIVEGGKGDAAKGFGLRVATGRAAARIAPSPARAADAPLLIEAMLAAGHVEAAADWWAMLDEADTGVRARAFALLAPVSRTVAAEGDLLNRFARETSAARAERVRAGLHGLGLRLGDPPQPADNAWTRALDAAIAARRPGEILVLAAAGLQGRMADLEPDQFRRLVAALVAAGFEEEARLMVSEAATRD